MTNSRIVSFDLLKFVGISLVIWGHCIAAFGSTSYGANEYYLVPYSFKMPLFMMMSGYFFEGKASVRPFSDLLRKKSIQLLLPAITWGIVIACLGILFRLIRGDVGLFVHLVESLFSSLWFLKCLFLCYVFGRLANNNF